MMPVTALKSNAYHVLDVRRASSIAQLPGSVYKCLHLCLSACGCHLLPISRPKLGKQGQHLPRRAWLATFGQVLSA